MGDYTIAEQIAEVERELLIRGRTYARWILQGKITARAAEVVDVTAMGGRETMTVPGDGSVSVPPGKLREQDRSAANFATPMDRVK